MRKCVLCVRQIVNMFTKCMNTAASMTVSGWPVTLATETSDGRYNNIIMS